MRGLIMKSTNSSATTRDASRQVPHHRFPEIDRRMGAGGIFIMIRTFPLLIASAR